MQNLAVNTLLGIVHALIMVSGVSVINFVAVVFGILVYLDIGKALLTYSAIVLLVNPSLTLAPYITQLNACVPIFCNCNYFASAHKIHC